MTTEANNKETPESWVGGTSSGSTADHSLGTSQRFQHVHVERGTEVWSDPTGRRGRSVSGQRGDVSTFWGFLGWNGGTGGRLWTRTTVHETISQSQGLKYSDRNVRTWRVHLQVRRPGRAMIWCWGGSRVEGGDGVVAVGPAGGALWAPQAWAVRRPERRIVVKMCFIFHPDWQEGHTFYFES